jgi:hypothetical protein
LKLAATQVLSGRQGEPALVGLSKSDLPLRIDGERLSNSTTTAVVEPVGLEAADSLGAAPPPARLVSSLLSEGTSQVDVYDFDLPAGLKAPVTLGYTFVDSQPQTSVRSVEVFDWNSRSWRALPRQSAATSRPANEQLTDAEAAGGTVRIRVRESEVGQANLVLSDR